MRLLLAENCPRGVADALAASGHDLFVVVARAPGATDRELATLAAGEDRLIITEDFDFGDLAVRDQVAIPGVILVAMAGRTADEKAQRLLATLETAGDGLRDHLTVLEAGRTRRRRLR